MTDGNMTNIIGPRNMLNQILVSQRSLGYKLFQDDGSNKFDE
jgi:hypothetical protein